jgi:hypothetical protein
MLTKTFIWGNNGANKNFPGLEGDSHLIKMAKFLFHTSGCIFTQLGNCDICAEQKLLSTNEKNEMKFGEDWKF